MKFWLHYWLLSLALVSLSGHATESTVTRVGQLAQMIMQHPNVASPFEGTFYFDIKDGQQIIVTYPENMVIPKKQKASIELTGTIHAINLGGLAQTKSSYKNQAMRLISWRYLPEPDYSPCWYTAKSSAPNMAEFSEHTLCAKHNQKGKLILNPSHLNKIDFSSNGLAVVNVAKQFYYVNQRGQSIAVVTFDNFADDFQAGLVRVIEQKKIGFADKTLTTVIPARYDWASPFFKDTAVVCIGCQIKADGEHSRVTGGKWGKINRSGQLVEPLKEANIAQ